MINRPYICNANKKTNDCFLNLNYMLMTSNTKQTINCNIPYVVGFSCWSVNAPTPTYCVYVSRIVVFVDFFLFVNGAASLHRANKWFRKLRPEINKCPFYCYWLTSEFIQTHCTDTFVKKIDTFRHIYGCKLSMYEIVAFAKLFVVDVEICM